jgi:hypothetical protein
MRRADAALCAPSLTPSVEDSNPTTVALTGNAGVLVAGCSNALCSAAAQAKNSATLVSVTAGGVALRQGSCVISGITTGSVEFCATDSRGFTTSRTVTLPLVGYVPLRCNPVAKRTDPVSGNAVLTLTGSCFAGNFGAANNPLTITVVVGEQTFTLTPQVGVDHRYEATLSLSDLDYTRAHPVTVTATDRLGRVVKSFAVPKGEPVFDWGEKDFRFHVPVTGAFRGSFQGVCMQTFYVSAGDTLRMQSCFAQYQSGVNGRQSIFLFGSANNVPVYGLITVNAWGGVSWNGTDGVSVGVLGNGQLSVKLPAVSWDVFTALSGYTFEFI